MLSGEGNAGERWKTAIGLISKKTTLHVQHTFFYSSLPLFCTTTTRNFQKRCYGGNVVRVLIHFFFSLLLIFSLHCWPLFFTAAHFLLALLAAGISHFVTTATKFSFCSSNKKKSPLFFISHSRSLSRFFSLSFAGLPPTLSFSLSFSCSIFQICEHDN